VKKSIISIVVFLGICICLWAQEEVLTVSGVEKLKIDEIVSDASGTLCIFAGGARKECTTVISVKFGTAAKKVKYPFVAYLTNGDRIGGKVTGGAGDTVTLESESLGKLSVKFGKLRGLFVPENISEKGFVVSKLGLNNSSDVVFLKEGSVTEGLVEKISESGVSIKVKSLEATPTLPFEKISGVLLTVTESVKKPEGLSATIYTSDGSCISGKLVAMKGDSITIDSLLSAGFPVKKSDVESIYFTGGNFTYLSDIIPVNVVETPFFDNFLYPYQNDRSLENKEPISVRGKIYRKGVSAHSKTELTYDLDSKYALFFCKLAIEDEAKRKGNVTILIYGDDKELHKSEDITGKSEPVSVKIDVKGVKKLKLVVDFGKNFDTMDRAVFADAVLVK
jgi:sRNA-binding regulator protein Hfq